MDAIDILGSLLGHKSSRSGRGTDILKDIFKGGSRSETTSRSEPRSRPEPHSRSTPSATASPNLRPGDIAREARELEDLLNVANQRSSRRRTGQSQPPQRQQPSRPDPDFRQGSSVSGHRDTRSDGHQCDAMSQDGRALVLVRAMVNAAKSDGQISQSEQQSILERVGDTSRETIQFLREEFARPLDVREFAWSVPIGMEQQVYTMSLIAIDLDTNREASYLIDLAHGLRIPANFREQIHQRLGAPSIH